MVKPRIVRSYQTEQNKATLRMRFYKYKVNLTGINRPRDFDASGSRMDIG